MIAFTADNHIGITSQWSLKERKNDFMSSFHDMVEKIGENSDGEKCLIIGGDLFDTAHPPSFAVEFVQNEIRMLRNKYGCNVFGIDGNHDIAENKWLTVCGITPLTDNPITIDGEHGITACGISYRRSSEILETLNAMADQGVKCDILVLHLAFGELNRMGSASDITAAEIMPSLKAMGVKLVLMGHIHIRQEVVVDGVKFAYCGSTEMCSMNEPKDKSFDLVDPETMDLSPVPLRTRKIEHTVIGNEKEFAAYESSVTKDSDKLQALYIVTDVQDGVKRLRAIAKENNLMMRIQIIHPKTEDDDSSESSIDRSTGIIGLEQAIELSFSHDSKEADLVRSILKSPGTLKLTIENFMKEEV